LLNFGLILLVGGIRWLGPRADHEGIDRLSLHIAIFQRCLNLRGGCSDLRVSYRNLRTRLVHSMLWVFRSTIVYAVAIAGYELIHQGPPPEPAIIPVVAVLWVLVWLINLLLALDAKLPQKRVLRILFLTALTARRSSTIW